MSYQQWQQPNDQPPQYRAPQPYPPQPPCGYAVPPVVVNVTQNAVTRPIVVRRRVAHGWHLLATLMTGGLWAPLWIRAARRRRVVYYR